MHRMWRYTISLSFMVQYSRWISEIRPILIISTEPKKDVKFTQRQLVRHFSWAPIAVVRWTSCVLNGPFRATLTCIVYYLDLSSIKISSLKFQIYLYRRQWRLSNRNVSCEPSGAISNRFFFRWMILYNTGNCCRWNWKTRSGYCIGMEGMHHEVKMYQNGDLCECRRNVSLQYITPEMW